MWNTYIAQEDTPRDEPCVQWLKEVIEIAKQRMQKMLLEMDSGKLAESGKAIVLKTIEA